MLIKSFDPVEAYLCEEGMARFATNDYYPPHPANMKNMFMHLTNYSLNKNSENYKPCENDDFLGEDYTGSKRLMS